MFFVVKKDAKYFKANGYVNSSGLCDTVTWVDRAGFASVKKAEALVAGDRIRFNNRDLMTNDGHPTPLQAEVIRIVPVFPGDRIAIFTVAGVLTPVAPEKEFLLVEGDFDPTAAPTVYPSEVKVPEVVDGRSIE